MVIRMRRSPETWFEPAMSDLMLGRIRSSGSMIAGSEACQIDFYSLKRSLNHLNIEVKNDVARKF